MVNNGGGQEPAARPKSGNGGGNVWDRFEVVLSKPSGRQRLGMVLKHIQVVGEDKVKRGAYLANLAEGPSVANDLGLEPKDRLIAVESQNVMTLPFDQIVGLIRKADYPLSLVWSRERRGDGPVKLPGMTHTQSDISSVRRTTPSTTAPATTIDTDAQRSSSPVSTGTNSEKAFEALACQEQRSKLTRPVSERCGDRSVGEVDRQDSSTQQQEPQAEQVCAPPARQGHHQQRRHKDNQQSGVHSTMQIQIPPNDRHTGTPSEGVGEALAAAVEEWASASPTARSLARAVAAKEAQDSQVARTAGNRSPNGNPAATEKVQRAPIGFRAPGPSLEARQTKSISPTEAALDNIKDQSMDWQGQQLAHEQTTNIQSQETQQHLRTDAQAKEPVQPSDNGRSPSSQQRTQQQQQQQQRHAKQEQEETITAKSKDGEASGGSLSAGTKSGGNVKDGDTTGGGADGGASKELTERERKNQRRRERDRARREERRREEQGLDAGARLAERRRSAGADGGRQDRVPVGAREAEAAAAAASGGGASPDWLKPLVQSTLNTFVGTRYARARLKQTLAHEWALQEYRNGLAMGQVERTMSEMEFMRRRMAGGPLYGLLEQEAKDYLRPGAFTDAEYEQLGFNFAQAASAGASTDPEVVAEAKANSIVVDPSGKGSWPERLRNYQIDVPSEGEVPFSSLRDGSEDDAEVDPATWDGRGVEAPVIIAHRRRFDARCTAYEALNNQSRSDQTTVLVERTHALHRDHSATILAKRATLEGTLENVRSQLSVREDQLRMLQADQRNVNPMDTASGAALAESEAAVLSRITEKKVQMMMIMEEARKVLNWERTAELAKREALQHAADSHGNGGLSAVEAAQERSMLVSTMMAQKATIMLLSTFCKLRGPWLAPNGYVRKNASTPVGRVSDPAEGSDSVGGDTEATNSGVKAGGISPPSHSNGDRSSPPSRMDDESVLRRAAEGDGTGANVGAVGKGKGRHKDPGNLSLAEALGVSPTRDPSDAAAVSSEHSQALPSLTPPSTDGLGVVGGGSNHKRKEGTSPNGPSRPIKLRLVMPSEGLRRKAVNMPTDTSIAQHESQEEPAEIRKTGLTAGVESLWRGSRVSAGTMARGGKEAAMARLAFESGTAGASIAEGAASRGSPAVHNDMSDRHRLSISSGAAAMSAGSHEGSLQESAAAGTGLRMMDSAMSGDTGTLQTASMAGDTMVSDGGHEHMPQPSTWLQTGA